MKQVLLWVVLLVLLFPSPVYAYLDPGSGSFFIQIIIATVVSSLFFAKTYWRKIKGILIHLLKRLKNYF